MIEDNPVNLLIQDSDLRRLEDLNPSVMNGFIKIYQKPIAATIRLRDSEQLEEVDKQMITLSVYQRGAKEPDSIKIEITSEIDLFLNLSCTITVQTYEELRKANRLNINFKDYVRSIAQIFDDSEQSLVSQNKNLGKVQLILTTDAGQASILKVFKSTQYKVLEILSLRFYPAALDKVNQSILFRYNFKKAKLKVLQNSIQSVYSLLSQQNPSLLQYITRTVGLINLKNE